MSLLLAVLFELFTGPLNLAVLFLKKSCLFVLKKPISFMNS